MLARNETIFKWALYAGATLLFFLLQGALLQRLTLWGVIPFVFPVLTAVLGMYEGPLPGSIYGLILGVIGINGVPEALVAAVLTAFVASALLRAGVNGPAKR